MKKITLLFASVLISFCASAQSFTALYDFDSVKTTSGITDPSPLPTATGVTFGSFSATGTPANPNATARFSYTDWSTGALTGETVYANLTGAALTSEYYEVTIAPSGVYTLSISSISFTLGRSSTGIRTYSVRSDADGYAANLPASITPANPNLSVQTGDIFFLNTDITTTSQNGSTITLSGAAFTNISTPRTFRFYGWNSEATTGTFSIDNVLIDGTATAPAFLNADFSATSACLGTATAFTDMSTGPNAIVSWLWDFGDGSGVSTLQNPSYTYAAAGAYTVSLMVIDNMAVSDNHVATVTVYDKPVAGFTAPTSVCSSTIVQFLDGSTIISGSITGWNWNFGDPASGINNTSLLEDPLHTYYTQMVYTATEIVTSDMGCKDTATVMIAVDSVGVTLNASVAGGTVTYTGFGFGGAPGYSYLLNIDDGSGFSITTPNYIYTYPAPGVYNPCLVVYDQVGCSDTTCITVTIISTGITEMGINDVSIIPNPSNNGVFTMNAAHTSNISVRVYNILGKTILAQEIAQGNNTIDLSAEANGSYFISIQTEKESITKKIIINK